jgi:hypothetical protein
MDSIILEFDKSDVELRDALAHAFGDPLTMIETKNFDGGAADVVHVIVPIISALTPLLVAYLTRPKPPALTRRVVVTNTGSVNLEGYTTEEVKRLLEQVRSNASK